MIINKTNMTCVSVALMNEICFCIAEMFFPVWEHYFGILWNVRVTFGYRRFTI